MAADDVAVVSGSGPGPDVHEHIAKKGGAPGRSSMIRRAGAIASGVLVVLAGVALGANAHASTPSTADGPPSITHCGDFDNGSLCITVTRDAPGQFRNIVASYAKTDGPPVQDLLLGVQPVNKNASSGTTTTYDEVVKHNVTVGQFVRYDLDTITTDGYHPCLRAVLNSSSGVGASKVVC